MKTFLKFSALFLVALLFTNCEDVKEGATIEGLTGDATINGVVFVNSNQTTGNTTDELANGAAIRVTYNVKDLSYSSRSSAPNYPVTIETTTDNNGRFSVTVPTVDKGVTFTVEADQFKTTITRDSGTKEAYFPKKSTTVSLKIGEVMEVSLNYGSVPQIEL